MKTEHCQERFRVREDQRLLLFPRDFTVSVLWDSVYRIGGERDRIFKCGTMIACARARPRSVTILDSNYSSRNFQRAIKMKGRKGKGELSRAMHVVRGPRWETTPKDLLPQRTCMVARIRNRLPLFDSGGIFCRFSKSFLKNNTLLYMVLR